VRRAKIAALVLGLVSIGLIDPVVAQLSIIPPEVTTKVRALGPVLNDEVRSSARSLYAPLHTKPGPEIVVNTDLPYGPDERQKLDVLAPAFKPPAAMPVVVFVHGGMFTRGDKTTPGTPFFQHIAAFWARNGMVGVNINYRLAPKHQWPAGAQDVGAAVKWVRDNIRGSSGDPSRIVLMGQSAGASHIAGYLFHKELWLSGGDGVIGAILLSGGYDPTARQTDARRAYYGDDHSLWADRFPLRHIAARIVPIFIAFAEYDPPRYQLDAISLFRALCERDNRCPPMKQLLGHNHLTAIYHIGTNDHSISADLLAFVRDLK
jgi:acetyl esterase/lipase